MTGKKNSNRPICTCSHATAGMAHKGDTFPETNRVIAAAAALKYNLVLLADDFVYNLQFD